MLINSSGLNLAHGDHTKRLTCPRRTVLCPVKSIRGEQCDTVLASGRSVQKHCVLCRPCMEQQLNHLAFILSSACPFCRNANGCAGSSTRDWSRSQTASLYSPPDRSLALALRRRRNRATRLLGCSFVLLCPPFRLATVLADKTLLWYKRGLEGIG